jgi:N-methylhydantoinase A
MKLPENERVWKNQFNCSFLPIKPIATKYLNNLTDNLRKLGYKHNLYIMQSNGGITTVDDVKANQLHL